MPASEIVIHHVERYGSAMILDLFGKRIGQSCEPAHGHSHCEVLSLDLAGRNVTRIGSTDHSNLIATNALCRAVAGWSSWFRSVNLVKHRIVDLFTESI